MHRLLLFFVFRVCYICLCLLAAPSRFSSAAWTRGARLPGMLTSEALSYGVGYLFPLRPITWICKQACAQGVAWGGEPGCLFRKKWAGASAKTPLSLSKWLFFRNAFRAFCLLPPPPAFPNKGPLLNRGGGGLGAWVPFFWDPLPPSLSTGL